MSTRTLGRSGIAVSALGFGSWAIGGPYTQHGSPTGWGPVDDSESVAAIHRALDLGVTFIDTADVYGCGHSERVVGKAIQGRDDVVVATKFGYAYDEAAKTASESDPTPAYIKSACEASLRRLGREVIDLYQFHLGGYPVEDVDPILETLDGLVDAGKIRSYGWSTDDPVRAARFAESPNCSAIQQAFNPLQGNKETLAVCEENNLASVVRGPLLMGLLTGRMTDQTRFGDDDVRHGWDLAGAQQGVLEKAQRLADVLSVDGRTPAQGALAWLLARSPAFVPIPGVRTVAQAEENFSELSFTPLTKEQLEAVDAVLAG